MKRKLKTGLVLMASSLLVWACSKDDAELATTGLNASGSIEEVAQYSVSDLVGTWNIFSMTANIPVNLNFDQTSSTDILSETDCFDPMFFSFDSTGKITTGQAKLDFEPIGDPLACGYGTYEATYEVSGNSLLVSFDLNGEKLTKQKTIRISKDTTGTYLHISLEDYEAAQYVKDPGNTSASNVERIETIYKLEK